MLRAWRWFALAAAVVAADQVTKAIVLGRFALGERLEVTGFFNMVLVYNKGAAFSFLSDAAGWQTPALIVFALVAIGIVGTFIVRSPGRRLLCTGLALILGGAAGNLVDRVTAGYVVDFVDLYWSGWHFWAFNVADASITVGVALMILDMMGAGSRHVSRAV